MKINLSRRNIYVLVIIELDMKLNLIQKGLFWNSFASITKYGLSFIAIMVLARMLTPDDYGLIGIISIFISLAEVVIDAGLSGALVKKQNVKDIDYSTLTFYNLGVSVLLYLIYFMMASWIAKFYDRLILTDLIRLYSIVILIHAFVIAPRTILIKQLRFKLLSMINLLSGVVGLSVAIILAYCGYGVYSLIWQYIVTAVISSVLIYKYSYYRIKWGFSVSSFKEQFSFGINTTLATSLKTFQENIYSNIVAKYSSITQAGYYTQADKLTKVLIGFFFNMIDTTFFPILSQEKNHNQFCDRVKSVNLKMGIAIILAFGLTYSVSEELILILLGEKWIEVKWTLKMLLLVGLCISASNLNRNVLKSLGVTFSILKSEFYIFILGVLLLLFTVSYGYEWIVLGYLLCSIVRFFYFAYLSGRQIGYTIKEQLLGYLPVLTVVVISQFLICDIQSSNVVISLVVKTLIYMIFVGVSLFALKIVKINN